VNDLVRWLVRRGVRITLVTPPPTNLAASIDTSAPDNLTLAFVPYLTFPFAGRLGTTVVDRSTAYPFFGYRAGRAVATLVDRGGFQLVHAHGASGLGYARARTRNRIGTVPFVLNPHGLEEFGTDRQVLKRLAYRPLQMSVRATARGADRIVATDRSLEDTVVGHLGVSRDRVSVVPNAVDLEAIDQMSDPSAAAELRQALGLGSDDLLLVSAGRLEANKGFDCLVRALSALSRAGAANGHATPGERWRWVLLGEGPDRRRLERVIEAHGLGPFVVLKGRVGEAELHAWYDAASLFVHPTLYEGSSIVTLEAMAHRRPVVATTAGGLPDKVRPGVNGWLVPPGDASALAGALGEAFAARSRWAEMGQASRAIVERDFAWSRVIERWLDLYVDVLVARPVLSPKLT
jgi:glycosyltransferase involved in cell wall biosynthesis